MQRKIKYKILSFAAVFLAATLFPTLKVGAVDCPDVRIIFARGSGGERWKDKNFLEFRTTIEEKLKTTRLSFEFVDLDYPAIGVGIENLSVTLGAFFGAGEAYEFGKSVQAGVNNLVKLVNGLACPNTKYVLGGYSQGAMVVSKALPKLNESRIIYAATFGDPKIYLPEGGGLVPSACAGKNLSDYRMYVPDCRAYKGLLGAYVPYRPESLKGKVGTWCNKKDIFCSSRFNISDHVSYVSDELYEDASKVIFDKICKDFGIENRLSSPHDTVIMLDSTISMATMIDKYKDEAIRLARETLESGGRVALYDYRDLDDPYAPVEHCNFETCTLEVFTSAIESIEADGGGDFEESLLSAAFTAMRSLNWRFGATKSMVVLTDAAFLLPDRDGITLDEVIRLSKEIDPVNFYIITKPTQARVYSELASQTDGMVVTNFGKLDLLTDYIMARYDSLPRVEEEDFGELPTLEVLESSLSESGEARVRFKSSSGRAIVILNEAILGVTEESEITASGILSNSDELILVPITDDARGEGVLVSFNLAVPKAPNTGWR